MSNVIEFQINKPPIDDYAFESLDCLDEEIKARVAIRTKIAKAILDEMDSGKNYPGVRRVVVKTSAGASEEHLIIGYEVRYRRSLNEGPAVPFVDPKA